MKTQANDNPKLNRSQALIILTLVLFGFWQFSITSSAQTSPNNLQAQIDSDNKQIAALEQKIAELQAALTKIGADKKTLQAAIRSLDLQRSALEARVAVTQRQINTTQIQIQQLGAQIDDTRETIASDKAALAVYLQNIQQNDDQTLLVKVLSSDHLSNFWSDFNSILQIQNAVREKTEALKTHEDNLSDAQATEQSKRDALAAQKQSLTSQQQSLTATVRSKTQLLAQTKAQESNYQKLLAAAKKELESYSAFTRNAGGAGLLSNQTVCDSWGCYYNQRDSSWGGMALNGTKYSLASDGCLVTAMAMVMTHYGYKSVTPVSINSNPSNFASYFPAFLNVSINVAGVNATRVTTLIDATLATGHPVVVGLRALGGTHFVVLVSGSRGQYIMRDPYVSNGKDISFTSKYSIGSIYKIQKVVIGG